MNSIRCVGLLLVMSLSACDAEKPPAPPPIAVAQIPAVAPQTAVVQAPALVRAPIESAPVEVAPVEKMAAEPAAVHHLAANLPVVRVVAAGKPDQVKADASRQDKKAITTVKAAAIEQKALVANAKSAKVKADNAEIANRAPVASKSKSAAQVVKETRLPKASLDLSLPPDMVKQLIPPLNVITAAPKAKPPAGGSKPLLPKMFPDATSDPEFELQGRLLSNEMQLQLRNESRKEVEGAALDFTFKQ